jgi:Ca2+-binding RTX toxin-like protein/glucose/arabinose dehydrogenase
MPVNLVVGNDGTNSLQGTAGADLIYGYDPNGPQSEASGISATRVATGFGQPVFAGAPPGDTGRLFIVEKTGLIKILDLATGVVQATPFLDVTDQIFTTGESGLLGLAFDPNFATNGFFYVHLINNPTVDAEIRRYQVSSDPNVANAASVTPIITIDQTTNPNHKAGWIGFGPDGYLYIASGDGAPSTNGQNLNTLLGKISRIDVNSDAFPGDPARNYAVPADNPFAAGAGADEIFALGLRNPWRNSFDRGLGDFYIADVGAATWEEVNLGQIGANYGWDVFEGPDVFFGGTPTGGSAVAPIHFYGRSVGQSITGGYVYRGEAEALQGQYFFADFVQGKVFTLRLNGTTWVATERTSQIVTDFGTVGNVSSFGEDARGNLYLVDFDGDIFRLTPTVASADQADVLRGLGGNDLLYGGSGNDTVDGGAGADALVGGPGTDTADYSSSAAGVNVNLLTGLGTAGDAQGDVLTGIENIIGSAHDDTLAGGVGANALVGGLGNDAYIVVDGGDAVVENAAEGTDTVFSTIHLQLPANVENLVLQGSADLQAYGNGLVNVLVGNSGDNILNGDAGADAMFGGAGNDAYFADHGADVAIENADEGTDTVFSTAHLRLSANVEYLVLQGSADLQGGGNSLVNVIIGNSGSNFLDGDAGADGMFGGAGNDVYLVDNAGDAAIENADEGNDVVFSTAHFRLAANVETLVLQGSADLQGGGNSLVNVIIGNSGNNLLDGDAGADAMFGGAGNDIYFVDNAGDAVVENADEGEDIVLSTAHIALSANVETLVLQGSANLQGYGNSGANKLYGNSGNNLLNGGAGADIMVGGAGNDVYFVDDAGDLVGENASEGTDAVFATVNYTLSANVETLVLQGSGNLSGTGNALANKLHGNSGDNSLDGGADADLLRGNGGNDTFVFNVGQADGDTIVDFDGNGPGAGDALQFVGYGGGATFTQIDLTRWQVNYNGDSSHDVITFMNGAPIDPSDFSFV